MIPCAQPKRTAMPILHIILVVVVIGIILWLVNHFVPMEGRIKKILNIVVAVLVVIWLLKALGVFSWLEAVNV